MKDKGFRFTCFLALLLVCMMSVATVFAGVQDNMAVQKVSVSQEDPALRYVTVDSSYVEIPGTQTIVAGFDAEALTLEAVSLVLTEENSGEEITVEASEIDEESAVFRIDYADDSQIGSYLVKSIICTSEGVSSAYLLQELGMEIRYGVCVEIETSPDAVGMEETGDMGIVSVEGEGDAVSETAIEEVIEQIMEEVPVAYDEANDEGGAARKNDLVIVLDPGHDNKHAGAQENNLQEEKLNLKIAQACREELEQYSGVTVYMTRDDSGACPYPGTTSTVCNLNRVIFAESVHADFYVSFHINSSTSSKPKGVEIYYPNKNYRPDLSEDAYELAQQVLDKLVALGLAQREVKVWNSQDGSKYPDGSLADYLGVIKQNKLRGIPAILIEHAFISNGQDAAFLSSDENLKKLGQADAAGIVSYFALKKTDLDIQGITCNSSKDGVALKVAYTNAGKPAEVQWRAYRLDLDRWETISDWSGSSETFWKPEKANYQLQVNLRDENGVIEEYIINYTPYTNLYSNSSQGDFATMREKLQTLQEEIRQKDSGRIVVHNER